MFKVVPLYRNPEGGERRRGKALYASLSSTLHDAHSEPSDKGIILTVGGRDDCDIFTSSVRGQKNAKCLALRLVSRRPAYVPDSEDSNKRYRAFMPPRDAAEEEACGAAVDGIILVAENIGTCTNSQDSYPRFISSDGIGRRFIRSIRGKIVSSLCLPDSAEMRELAEEHGTIVVAEGPPKPPTVCIEVTKTHSVEITRLPMNVCLCPGIPPKVKDRIEEVAPALGLSIFDDAVGLNAAPHHPLMARTHIVSTGSPSDTIAASAWCLKLPIIHPSFILEGLVSRSSPKDDLPSAAEHPCKLDYYSKLDLVTGLGKDPTFGLRDPLKGFAFISLSPSRVEGLVLAAGATVIRCYLMDSLMCLYRNHVIALEETLKGFRASLRGDSSRLTVVEDGGEELDGDAREVLLDKLDNVLDDPDIVSLCAQARDGMKSNTKKMSASASALDDLCLPLDVPFTNAATGGTLAVLDLILDDRKTCRTVRDRKNVLQKMELPFANEETILRAITEMRGFFTSTAGELITKKWNVKTAAFRLDWTEVRSIEQMPCDILFKIFHDYMGGTSKQMPAFLRLSACSKTMQNLVFRRCPYLWTSIDFTLVDEKHRRRIRDRHLEALLRNSNAITVTTRLILRGCSGLRGSGIEPLLGSKGLLEIDLQFCGGRHTYHRDPIPDADVICRVVKSMPPFARASGDSVGLMLLRVDRYDIPRNLPSFRITKKWRVNTRMIFGLQEAFGCRLAKSRTCRDCNNPLRRQLLVDYSREDLSMEARHAVCPDCQNFFCGVENCRSVQICGGCSKLSCERCTEMSVCSCCSTTFCCVDFLKCHECNTSECRDCVDELEGDVRQCSGEDKN